MSHPRVYWAPRHWRAAAITALVIALLLGGALPAAAAPTATVCLIDSTGTGIEGATATYRAGGWQSVGTTGVDGCVSTEAASAVGNVVFRISLNGQYEQTTHDTTVDPTVVFRTVAVVNQLTDATGTGIEGGSVRYYASGWKTLGTTDASGSVSGQLLGQSTTFGVTHNGQYEQKTQDTRVDPTVTFATISVESRLVDSSGSGIEGGSVRYYASGWKTLGITDASGSVLGELLGQNTTFGVTYNGQYLQVTQDTRVDPTIVFGTAAVESRFVTSSGVGIEGALVQYYASGWKTLGTTDASGSVRGELIPANTTFRITHNGQTLQTTQDTRVDPVVPYQTGAVLQGVGPAVLRYYASGWKTFDEGVELLPVNTTFDLETGPNVARLPVAGASTYVPAAPTPPVVDLGPDRSIAENDSLDLSVLFTDQEADQTHTATIAWGDGSELSVPTVVQVDGLAGLFTAAHTYPDDGVFTVEACVTDDGGPDAIGCATLTLVVGNVAPVPTITGLPDVVLEGDQVSLGSEVVDAGPTDEANRTWTVTVDSTVVATGTEPAFSFPVTDEGTHVVALTVDDGDGGVGTVQAEVAVENVAPTVAIVGLPESVTEDSEVSLGSTVYDPGVDDVITLSWTATLGGVEVAFGPGPDFAFIPADPGTYLVTVTADDGDGGVGSAAAELTVTYVAPVVIIVPIPVVEPDEEVVEPPAPESVTEIVAPTVEDEEPVIPAPKPASEPKPEAVTPAIEIPTEVLDWTLSVPGLSQTGDGQIEVAAGYGSEFVFTSHSRDPQDQAASSTPNDDVVATATPVEPEPVVQAIAPVAVEVPSVAPALVSAVTLLAAALAALGLALALLRFGFRPQATDPLA